MPKVAYATAQEAQELEARLQQALQAACAAAVKQADANADNKIKAESGQISNNINSKDDAMKAGLERVAADAKSYTEVSNELVAKKISAQFPIIEEKIAKLEADLTKRIEKEAFDVRQVIASELSAVCEKFDEELMAVKKELAETLVAKHKDQLDRLAEVNKKLDEQIQDARKECQDTDEKRSETTDRRIKKAMDQQHKEDETRDERSQRAESEIWLKLGRLEDELKELTESAGADTENARNEAKANLDSLQDDHGGRIGHLDEETTKLRDAMAEVENFSTRRVDWVINKVSHRMRPSSPGSKASLHTSWFSPKFNMAGAHGLQLEIQLFRPSDPPVAGEAAGDCAVFLWACKGMSLVYKLHIGTKAATLEKVFNGRVPYGTKRLCFLKDQINRENDTLRVSVEILEAVRDVEHPIKPPPPPTDLDELEMAVAPLEGQLIFKRHLNNRLLDQVKSQCESMRSRMVRTIQWRLEKASLLRRCFPPGEALCSVPFAAAGIENMQLIFYPSGYGGVTDGFCSLFLHAPAGTTLKCSLTAGAQKRDASHFFEEAGAFGRTNYCRYEAIVEPDDDCIMLALEIDEAHQDVQARVSHPLVQPGDRRTQAMIDGDLPQKVDSVVKLKRCPGKTPPGMSESRILPNLWTAQCLTEAGNGDGMQSFDDIGGASQSAPVGRRPRGENQASPVGSISATKSMPAFKDVSSDQLPRLGRSAQAGGEWDIEGSIGGRGGGKGAQRNPAGRRARSMAGTT